MKKLMALLTTIVLAIFLFGCDGNTELALKIEGIRGHTDALINNEEGIVSFSVDPSVSTFDIADIILPEDVEVNVYADAEHTSPLDGVLSLEEGLNTYYLSLYIGDDDLLNASWTLEITRLNLSVTNIEVKSLQNTYSLGEGFTNGVLLVTYQGGSTKEVTLTQSMVTGFDTSTVGTKTLTITYEDVTTTYSYEVVNEVTAIAVKELANEYFVGDSFVAGLLTVTYADKSSEEITLTEAMVTGFDTTTVGTKTLTITYGSKTISYDIEVKENGVASIKVLTLKQNYFVGDAFEEGTLEVTYAKGNKETIALTSDLVTGFDTTTAGTKTLTITYGGLTITYEISVLEDTLESIAVKNLKDTYYVGNGFENGTLTLTYLSGKTEEVALTEAMVKGFDTTTVGNKILTITYGSLTITYDIIVIEDTVVAMQEAEFSYNYFVGDTFVPAKLNVTYASGKTETIDLTSDLVTGFDTAAAGTKTLTITYKGYSINVTITVSEVTLTSIAVKELKADYFIGDEFVAGTLTLTYDNGDVIDVTLTEAMVSDFDTTTAGTKTLTITYGGLTITYEISVLEDTLESIAVKDLKDTYYVGTTFENGTLTLTYLSGKTEEVALIETMVTGFDTTTAGNKTLTITYGGLTITYEISVIEDTVASIAVKSLKDTYYVGTTFEEGILTLTYLSGKTKEVALTEAMVTGFKTTEVGTVEITITYEDATTTYTINVVPDEVREIAVLSLENAYLIGDEFVEGKLAVTYVSGKSEEIALTEAMVTGFDTATAGTKTLTITYEGKTLEYAYTVSDEVVNVEVKDLENTYYVGQALGKDGKLVLTYAGGSTKEIPITPEMVIGFNSNKIGKQTLVISYDEYKLSYEITIQADVIVSIATKGLADSYYSWDMSSISEGKLELTYASGATKEISIQEATISNQEAIETTDSYIKYEIEFTYSGLTTTYQVTILMDKVVEIKADLNTTYYLNQVLDFNTKLTLIYASGHEDETTLIQAQVNGFDTSSLGEKIVTISYSGIEQEITITVVEDTVESINVLEAKNNYYVGEDYEVIVVEVVYASGNISSADVPLEMISGFDTETAGTKTLTITIDGVSKEFTITVVEDEVTKLNIVDAKDSYFVGDEYVESLVEVVYTSGKVEKVPLTLDMVTGFDTETAGVKTLTVTYKDFTTKYDITVNEDVIVSIEEENFTYTYFVGDEFIPANLIVTYASGKVDEVPLTLEMISGFDTAEAGTKALTIIYEGLELTIQINVAEMPLSGIEILDVKKVYYVGEDFVPGTLRLIYEDGSSIEVALTKAMLEAFDTSTIGSKTIIVNYGSATTEFIIEVIPDNVEYLEFIEIKNVYYIGEEFANIKANVHYQSGKVEEITITADMVEDFYTDYETVSYATIIIGDFKEQFEYEVRVDKITGITNISIPKTYYIGDEFVEGTMDITYESGKVETVPLTSDLVPDFDTSSIGTKTIQILYFTDYDKLSVPFDIEVVEPAIASIKVKSLKATYYVGDKFSSGILTVTYVNDLSSDITLTEDMVEGFTTDKLGAKTLTITYKEHTTTYEIMVVDDEVVSIGIADLANQYYVNDEFVTGSLALIYASGKKEVIDLSLDMVLGFTTQVAGYYTMTIVYNNLTTSYDYVVLDPVIDDAFVLPEKSTLDVETVKELIWHVMAMGPHEEYKTYEENYEYCKSLYNVDWASDFKNYLELAGVTTDDINLFINIITENLTTIVYDYAYNEMANSSDGKSLERLEAVLSDENLDIAKDVISRILSILDKNQWTILVTYLFQNMGSGLGLNDNYSTYIGQLIDLSLGDYNDYLKESGANKGVTDFIDGILAFNREYTFKYEDIYTIVDLGYNIIASVCQIANEDIRTIVLNSIKMIVFNEFTTADLVDLIQAACNALEVIQKETNNFAGLTATLSTVSNFMNKLSDPGYAISMNVLELVKGAIKYLDVIIGVARSMDTVIIDTIMNIQTAMNESDGSSLIRISKTISPLAEVLYTDNALNAALSELGYKAINLPNNKSFDKLLALIIKARELDETNEADSSSVFEEFYAILSDARLMPYTSRGYMALIKADATTEEIYAALADYYQSFVYQDDANQINTNIQINSTNVIIDTNRDPGVHEGYVIAEGLRYYFNYFLYDDSTKFEVANINFSRITSELFLVALDSNSLDDYSYDIYSSQLNYTGIDTILNNISVTITSGNLFNFIYLYGRDFDYEFILDSSSVGLKMGYIQLTGPVTFSIPFEYYVYDSANPTVTDFGNLIVQTSNSSAEYDKDEVIKIGQNTTIENLRLDYVLVNFKEQIKDISFAKEDIAKLDTTTLGSHTVNLIIYSGEKALATYEFTYEVVLDKELYQLRELELNQEVFVKESNIVLLDTTRLEYSNYMFEGYNTITFSSLKEYIKKYYDANAIVRLSVGAEDSYSDYINYPEIILEIVSGDTIYFSTIIKNVGVVADEYYEAYTEIEVNETESNLVAEDVNSLTVQELVDSLGTVTLVQRYAGKSEEISGDIYNQLIAKGITITFETKEMEYGLTYSISFDYKVVNIWLNSSNSSSSVLTINAYAKEYENTVISIDFDLSNTLVLFNLSIEDIKTALTYCASINVVYPLRKETISGNDILSFLDEHKFNIDSIDEYGYINYSIDNFKGTIYSQQVTEPWFDIYLDSEIYVNANSTEEEVRSAIINSIRTLDFGRFSITNTNYIAYLLSNAEITYDSSSTGRVQVTIRIDKSEANIDIYLFDIFSFDSYSFYLNKANCYFLVCDDVPTVDLIKDQIYIETWFNDGGRYVFTPADIEKFFSVYKLELNVEKNIAIISNEDNSFYRQLIYQVISTEEANQVVEIDLSSMGNRVHYDLNGNKFENETHLVIGKYDINNVLDYIFEISVSTPVSEIDYYSDSLVNFIGQYGQITKLAEDKYELVINYRNYSKTFDFIFVSQEDTIYYGMYYDWKDPNAVFQGGDANSLIDFLANQYFASIRVYGSDGDIYLYNSEDIKDFLNGCTIKEISYGAFGREYAIIYQYASINISFNAQPDLNRHLEELEFSLDSNAVITDGEVSVELVREQLKVYLQGNLLTADQVASIIDNYDITLDTAKQVITINYGEKTISQINYQVLTSAEAYEYTLIRPEFYGTNFEITNDLDGNVLENAYIIATDSEVSPDYVINNVLAGFRLETNKTIKHLNRDSDEYNEFLLNCVSFADTNSNRIMMYINYSYNDYNYPVVYTLIFETSYVNPVIDFSFDFNDNNEYYDSNSMDIREYLATKITLMRLQYLNGNVLESGSYSDIAEILSNSNIIEESASTNQITYRICYDYSSQSITINIKPDLMNNLALIAFYLPDGYITTSNADEIVTEDDVINSISCELEGYKLTKEDIASIMPYYRISIDQDLKEITIIYQDVEIANFTYNISILVQ